jgi:hypothetical protein
MYLPKKRFCRSRTLKLFTCQLRRLVKHMFLSVFALARLSLLFDTCEGHAESIEICGRRFVFGARKYVYLLAPFDSVKADAIQNPAPLCILQSASNSAGP